MVTANLDVAVKNFLDEVNIEIIRLEMYQITLHKVALSNQLKAVRAKTEVTEEEGILPPESLLIGAAASTLP